MSAARMAVRVHSEVEMSWIPRPSQRVMSGGSHGLIQSTPAMRDWTTWTPRSERKEADREDEEPEVDIEGCGGLAGDTDDLNFRRKAGQEFGREVFIDTNTHHVSSVDNG